MVRYPPGRCRAVARGRPPAAHRRLVVAPDLQGRGIGQRLLATAEAATRLPEATLFTGARSEANLRLYRRSGYEERAREVLRPGLELVHLVTSLPAAQR